MKNSDITLDLATTEQLVGELRRRFPSGLVNVVDTECPQKAGGGYMWGHLGVCHAMLQCTNQSIHAIVSGRGTEGWTELPDDSDVYGGEQSGD